jgi:hypothetical protein
MLLLGGCYSFSTLGRARIVEPRHAEVFAAPAVLVTTAGSGALVKPVGDLGVRYGLSERVELDARVTTAGLSAGPRLQLQRSSRFDALVAPALAFTWPDKLAFELPLVLGWNVRQADQIVVAPRLVYQARLGVPEVGHPVSFVLVGVSFGYAWQLSPRLTLFPELAFLTQAYAEPGFSSFVGAGLGMQGSVGVLLDW